MYWLLAGDKTGSGHSSRSVPETGDLQAASAELELLARCRQGDLEAFEAVYRLHEALVFRHAFHLLGHREDASDVRQETFLRAYRALPRFRGDCALRTFLLRICTNLCRDHVRARRRRGETSLSGDGRDPWPAVSRDGDEDGTSGALERLETTALVRAALAELPPVHREVIVLRDLEELSAVETAAVLGCAVGSVPVKLFRARRLLKDCLKRLMG